MRAFLAIATALALSVTGHAPAQCWGQATGGPVRVAPLPTVITPRGVSERPHGARDGEWTWDAHGRFWWRVKPAPQETPKAGCTCADKGACEDPDSCECRQTGKPCCARCLCVVVGQTADAVPNYGVDLSRLRASRSYSINGKPCSRQEAVRAVGDGLADDSGKDHLAVVGDPAFLARVRGYLDALPEWKGKVHAQFYGPGHWAVTARGLRPGVTLRSPAGEELAYAEDVQGGGLLDRLLKRQPKTPTPLTPDAPAAPGWPAWAFLLGAIALWLYRRRKERSRA